VENLTSIKSHELSLKEIAERGEDIYRQKYQEQFEQKYNGKFVVINVVTDDATVSDASHDAVRFAVGKDPNGLFHLMRIGRQAAFEGGWYMSSAT
jgi:hypothetical protein